MHIRHTARSLLPAFVASALLTGVALSTDAPAGRPEPSKEARLKMATLHEQMAACLRSDKAFADCRTAMMKGCQEQMGPDGCPMMGTTMGMGGMMHGPNSATPKQ